MRFIILLVGFIFILSCKKGPAEPVDCLGVSGGDAALDDCGTCDADRNNDCMDCSNDLKYNISREVAVYTFSFVAINGEPAAPNDTVWAFNGDKCVGSQQWDTSECNNGVCLININGYDGENFTGGYCKSGDIPTFKIYDVSENQYYYSIPSGSIKTQYSACEGIAPECLGWTSSDFIMIDSLIAIAAVPCDSITIEN